MAEMSAPRDWTRVTISMNIELNKRLKEKQYEMMKENANVSFSKLINHVLEEGLRYGNLEQLKH